MFKTTPSLLLMPNAVDGNGKSVSGNLVENTSDNNENALAADDDSSKGTIKLDDIFEEASGAVDNRKADDSDLAVKIDRNATPSVEEDEEPEGEVEIDEPKPEKVESSDPKNKVAATKDNDRLEGESDADKELRLKRDYSSFKPEDTELLKKLPNSIFAHVSKAVKARYAIESKYNETVKELNELKKNPDRIPDNWYENERAFELTPEYQRLSQQYDLAEYASEHWRRQLIAIKNNQPFQGLTMQNGQLVATGPFAASPENEVMVQQNLLAASNQMSQLSSQAEQLSAQFKSRHSEISKYYEGPETTAMFNRLAPELRPTDEEAALLVNVLHPAHKNHPVSNIAGKLFSLALRQARMIKSLRESSNVNKLNKEDNKAAGPSAKNKKVAASGGKDSQNGVIDFDELEEELTS